MKIFPRGLMIPTLINFCGVSDPGEELLNLNIFSKFETEFDKNLGSDSEVHMGLIYGEKKHRLKRDIIWL
jgi:hypothetical protein